VHHGRTGNLQFYDGQEPGAAVICRFFGHPGQDPWFVAAASTVVGILVSFPAATLSDFVGRRRLLLIAAFVFATAPSAIFLSMMSGLWYWYVSITVWLRLSWARLPWLLWPIPTVRGRGERMAWYSSADHVGRFLAPLLGGALIMGSNYHWVYLVDGILGVFALAAALFITFPAESRSAGR